MNVGPVVPEDFGPLDLTTLSDRQLEYLQFAGLNHEWEARQAAMSKWLASFRRRRWWIRSLTILTILGSSATLTFALWIW